MLRAIYSLLFYLLLPAVVLRVWWRSRREPRYSEDLAQRFGFAPLHSGGEAPVWVHAVSAGETIAARELIERLLLEGHRVIVSNMTPTGRERAEHLFGRRVTSVYAPYDMPLMIGRFLNRVCPKALIIIDTELWPNMIALSRKAGLPVYLVNGRLSKKSARGYKRMGILSRPMLGSITHVFAQTESQAKLFSGLGARSVTTSGSIKFDARQPADLPKRVTELQKHLAARPIILGASTHEGEESILLEAFLRLDGEELLVLAPRHSHRSEAVEALLKSQSISFQRHSDGLALDTRNKVYLLDTMGELIYFYGACQIAFVGGSLVNVGGHNPMEPGGLGKPILMGPYRRNIEDIAAQFADAGALLDVSDADDTHAAFAALMSDTAQWEKMSKAALEVMARNRGALDRVCAAILPALRENKL